MTKSSSAKNAEELFSFLFLLQTFFAMRFFLFITVYFLLAHFMSSIKFLSYHYTE